MKATLLLIVNALIAAQSCLSQGTFQNLNFENATVIRGSSPQSVPFGVAFPGWQGYFDLAPASSALYNNLNIGTSGFSLLDNQAPFGNTISNSTAVLQAGSAGFQPSVSLSQTGVVPTDSLSLRFIAGASFNQFAVAMNGQELSPIVLQSFGLFNEYAVDISAFAGQTAELRFTRPAVSGQSSALILDEISFSSIAIPEPSTWALLTLGLGLCWCATRGKRR